MGLPNFTFVLSCPSHLLLVCLELVLEASNALCEYSYGQSLDKIL